MTALLLTSCMGRDKDNSTDTGTATDTRDVHSNTLGDDNGDGNIEDGTDDGMNGGGMLDNVVDGAETVVDDIIGGVDDLMNGNSDTTPFDTTNSMDNVGSNFSEVEKVTSADDALNFIGANVYSRCQDVIPIMTETKILTTDEIDSLTYNTGITNTDGISDIIVSDSSLDSFAYSLVMLRTDGTSTDELHSQLGQSINPEKWLGVVAEKIATVKLDDDIVVVMGGSEQVDTIMNSVLDAANGVYENIGEIVNVLG